MNSSHFVWDGNPEIFTIPEFQLPFALSILGLVISFIAYQFFASKKKEGGSGKRDAGSQEHQASTVKLLALGILLLIIGQLIGLVLPGPTFESIGPIAPRWYGLLFALSFFLGYNIGARTFTDANLPLKYADSLFIYLMVGTILGARLGHVIFYDLDYYLRNPELILAFWEGGLASHGAVVGVLTSVWLFSRKHKTIDFLWVADRMALPFTLGGFFVRFGNFFNSEILGKPTDVPWAVVFAKVDDVARHPSMLYEAFWYLGAFGFFVWVYKKYETRPPQGALTALFLVVLFVGRFLIEFTKENQSAFEASLPINMGQILSLICIVIGAVWLSRINWKKN